MQAPICRVSARPRERLVLTAKAWDTSSGSGTGTGVCVGLVRLVLAGPSNGPIGQDKTGCFGSPHLVQSIFAKSCPLRPGGGGRKAWRTFICVWCVICILAGQAMGTETGCPVQISGRGRQGEGTRGFVLSSGLAARRHEIARHGTLAHLHLHLGRWADGYAMLLLVPCVRGWRWWWLSGGYAGWQSRGSPGRVLIGRETSS